MTVGSTQLAAVADQVQTFWSSLFMPELMETTVLPALVNKEYEGEIKAGGNTVRVSQTTRATATRKTVGANDDTFEANQLSTQKVDIIADQVFTAAFEFNSLVDLQSQIGQQDSAIRKGLLEAMEIELNNYVYSLINPSTSAPDHVDNGITDFNAAQLGTVRVRAAQAKWEKSKGWWLLLDPSYYQNILNATTMTSRDYVEGEAPVFAGQVVNKRFGFNILEDNSAGMSQVSPTAQTSQLGLAFHPDFLHLVLQKAPSFEVSSLHSQKRHGYIISATMVGGAKLGISGNVKHMKFYNT